MTREEAIRRLRYIRMDYLGYPPFLEPIDMAIEALHREEAEEKGWCHRIIPRNVEVVVRCKDCRYYWGNLSEDDTDEMYGECRWDSDEMPNADDFCSYGERKEI